ncbi:MAG: threonine synthase [Chloroflexota bacterium]
MSDTGSLLSHLECTYCGNVISSDEIVRLCPKNGCEKVLFPRYRIEEKETRKIFDSLKHRDPNMWRYKEFMPVKDDNNIVSLGEGFTPVLKSERLAHHLGIKNLLIKDESLNPTASFKARGISSAVSKAKEFGIRKFSIPSAGNAGGALAAYCAKAGAEAYVFMPEDAPNANKLETFYHGAHLELVNGFINDAGRKSAELSKEKDLFDVSTLKEPYRVEGKKTMGYEIAEQCNWNLPDYIVYPTGGGTGIIGIWKAFQELQDAGMIDSNLPKMICVQATGCSPVVDAYFAGERHAKEFLSPKSIAAGMRVPVAIGDYLIIDAIKESNGTGIKISDEQMIEGVKKMANLEGIFCAPEGGAIVSATESLVNDGVIESDDTVLLLNTGSAFKYLDSLNS